MAVPGTIGGYRIERLLGAGSFATVWLGYDAALGAPVAVKVLADNWSHDLRVRERFVQEFRLLRRLDNDRLVRVYAAGELPDGRPYSVMEVADGGSLRDRLAAGPVPVGVALWLLGEIAAGVAVLHAHSIVHRDLTPGNVLFRTVAPIGAAPVAAVPAERVLVADLGLAKALAAASGLTARAGTPGYMAPEQDDPLAVVDVRADVFGLGRLGLRLLGTAGPGDPRLPLRDGVPRPVAVVLRRATAPRPADRYPDAAAFGAALRHAAGGLHPTPAGARAATGPRMAGPRMAGSAAAGAGAAGPAAAGARMAGWRAVGLRSVGVLTVVAAVLATVAADQAAEPSPVATDSSGRISVVLPPGWRAYGSGWQGRVGDDGRLLPALVLSPDPGRWSLDPTVPGAFVGLLPGATGTATAFVASRQHAGCTAAPVRRARRGAAEWVIARYTCALGPPVVVEAAGAPPGSTVLLYVQLAPPPGPPDPFVDTLLTGVAVR